MINSPPTIDLSKYVDRKWFGERPHVRGRRLPIATVAYYARENQSSVADLMYSFTITEPEVLSALLYYAEHKAEIDAQEAAYAAVPIEDWIQHGKDALLFRRDDAAPRSE